MQKKEQQISGSNTTQKINAWIAVVAGLSIFFLCLHSIRSDINQMNRLDKVHEFLPARGLVQKIEVREDSARKNVFYPDVGYTYKIKDQIFSGWKFSYEKSGNSAQYWKDRMKNYHEGDSVNVYYHPREPLDAVLEKKNDGTAAQWISIGFASVFLLGSLVLIIMAGIFLLSGFFSRSK